MGDSLFNIFGDHFTRHSVKNVLRQPMSNDENKLKSVSKGPIKPNEPIKPMQKRLDDVKKTFLSNHGKAIQNTPLRQALTPRAVNVGSMIYNDVVDKSCTDICMEELEFTKPSYTFDNYHAVMLDILDPAIEVPLSSSPPATPSPTTRRCDMEWGSPTRDLVFSDDTSITAFPDDEDIFPELYSDDE